MIKLTAMKCLLILVIILNGTSSFSQNLELNVGINQNHFYDFNRDNPHYHSSYNSDYGYQIGVGINAVPLDTFLKMRFTLNYINYGGSFNVYNSGLGGGSSVSGHTAKSVLSLGIYPLNLKIAKRIDFNLGLEFSRLLWESVRGTQSSWQMNAADQSNDLNDRYSQFNSSMYVAISTRIAYPIRIGSRYSVSPQIGCYYGGLSGEFRVSGAKTKSFKEYFSIGVQRSI